MTRLYTPFILLSLSALSCCRLAVGQESTAQTPTQEQMMEKWVAFMTPGDNHKLLKFKEGTWDAKVKMWMAPGAPPTESQASSEAKIIMDGRYLVENVHGSFDGMPFEGISTVAYDNGQKKFLSTWIENMGTGIMFAEGTYDPAKKAWNFTAKSTDPITSKPRTTRSVERVVDDNTWVMQMYGPGPGGKEFQMMEITYTRKK